MPGPDCVLRDIPFDLWSHVVHSKIKTLVFATDSPYDRQMANIGSVVTPMFDSGGDAKHLEKLKV